jgi:hypothetical protein
VSTATWTPPGMPACMARLQVKIVGRSRHANPDGCGWDKAQQLNERPSETIPTSFSGYSGYLTQAWVTDMNVVSIFVLYRYKALEEAVKSVRGGSKPYSVSGSLPIVGDLKEVCPPCSAAASICAWVAVASALMQFQVSREYLLIKHVTYS